MGGFYRRSRASQASTSLNGRESVLNRSGGHDRRWSFRARSLALAAVLCSLASFDGLGETSRCPGSLLGFAARPAAPSRPRRREGDAASKQKRKEAAKLDKKVSMDLEKQFLDGLEKGVGCTVDPLGLADAISKLTRWPFQETRRLLSGDWRLIASDAGDLLVQLGSGIHGLPLVSISEFFLCLRVPSKSLRAIEVLGDIGFLKQITTILKGDVRLDENTIELEYTGMVDKDGFDTKQERDGATRKISARILYIGDLSLVLKVEASKDRKGGIAVFERDAKIKSSLREATGSDIKLYPDMR